MLARLWLDCGDLPVQTNPVHSRRLRKQATKNTSPERTIRQLLYREGRRYRVHYPVPGMPRRTIDIAFPRRRVAVFVDGCFWHGCAEHARSSRTNLEYWEPKIAGNRYRDLETQRHLEDAGWTVLRIWEHEQAFESVDRILTALGSGDK